MNDLSGSSFGRYHLVEKLGEGGMAVVYKAFDTRLECDVAVKVIRMDNLPRSSEEVALKRFEREAKAVAQLTHPNIVRVMDFGEEDGLPYLVMPFLPGGTLKQYLGKPMPYAEAAHLLQPVADALAYAHLHNVVHRDVKPSNILITELGQPMLTDFGIAKIMDLQDGQTLTGTGVGIGTPEYMAPEQWTGKITPAVDIYSLGVVFYELVTGQKPYTADTPAAILLKQANDPLPKPSSIVKGLPEGVENILYKALAKKPEDRYQSMVEVDHHFKLIEGTQLDLPNKNGQTLFGNLRILENASIIKPTAAPSNSDEAIQDESSATYLQEISQNFKYLRWSQRNLQNEPLLKEQNKIQDQSTKRECDNSISKPPIAGKTVKPNLFFLFIGWLFGGAACYSLYALYRCFDMPLIFGIVLTDLISGLIIGFFTWLSVKRIITFPKKHRDLLILTWVVAYLPITLSCYGSIDLISLRMFFANMLVGLIGGFFTGLQIKQFVGLTTRQLVDYVLVWLAICTIFYFVIQYIFLAIYDLFINMFLGDIIVWMAFSPLIPIVVWKISSGIYLHNLDNTNNPKSIVLSKRRVSLLLIFSCLVIGFELFFLYNYTNTFTKTKGVAPDAVALTTRSDGMPMIQIPATEFSMGSWSWMGQNDEHPRHLVYIDSFYIDQFEVTNAQYENCVLNGPCSKPHKGEYQHYRYGNPDYDSHPVIGIDWYQASSYCEWVGERLPTEAEWELAAKGKTNNIYPWGNDRFYKGKYYIYDYDWLVEVGRYPNGVSPYGVYDMAGNAWEWTSDWYDQYYYKNSPYKNPLGPKTSEYSWKVLRGGAFVKLSITELRSADRHPQIPTETDEYIGFRCAMPAK